MEHARSTAEERLELLSAWLDGELDEAEQATVAAHLEGCDECQAVLADLHAVRALLHTLPAPALPRSFELPEEEPDAGVTPTQLPAVASIPSSSASPDRIPEVEEDLVLPGDERAAALVDLEPALVPHPRHAPRWVRLVQQVGGLAAMIGLVLLLSSALLNGPVRQAASGAAAPASHHPPSGTINQNGSAGTATAPTFGAANPITATSAPSSSPFPSSAFGLTLSQPTLLVVIGLALIALGIVILVGGLLARRRYRGLAPRATAPPRA